MTVQELQERLQKPEAAPLVLDVREPWEFQLCSLPGSMHIPMGQIPARLDELDRDQEVVVLCHHGIRSQRICYFLKNHGFRNLANLHGGIDAWAREVDPGMTKY